MINIPPDNSGLPDLHPIRRHSLGPIQKGETGHAEQLDGVDAVIDLKSALTGLSKKEVYMIELWMEGHEASRIAEEMNLEEVLVRNFLGTFKAKLRLEEH